MKQWTFLCAVAGLALCGYGYAGEVFVFDDIAVSETWTADNVYNLQEQIFVLPGATLTIEAGTVLASTTALGGSLAVMPGAKIYVNGTKEKPVIMTSKADVATWDPDPSHPTGRNPKTGSWREGVNEWGNLTILGRGVISGSHFGGQPVSITTDDDGIPGGSTTTRTNTKVPDGLNKRQMEGLVAAFPGDPRVLYGGDNDNDDSGSITYLSIRYGGKVLGLGNELNGLSLGGIGRGTTIRYIEIMNNVDDGIEIWGGTVNIKYASIWNIGDDSFDCDQGWRGKAQFGLIVKGHSADAARGSGVCDNAFEMDGAEDSDAQPVLTSCIYNFTVIGQPLANRGGTAWRDNARVQYRNCIFMDLGQQLVRFDDTDGDGGSRYGFNGTLTWAQTWTTPAGTHSPVNAMPGAQPGDFNHPDTLYTAQQLDGNLAEIKDSVFFRNLNANAYTEADARGVRNPANNNVTATKMPIQNLTRGPAVTKGGLQLLPVTYLDPMPANDALTSVAMAPNDGFFTPANYRGAFAPNENWLIGWTASSAFGLTCRGDIDLDGLCDAQEGANTGLGAGQSNRLLRDSDGDGLGDGVEDADHDGAQSAGETGTRKRDSDNDLILDGIEVKLLNSDPLSNASPGAFTDADNDRLPDSIDPNTASGDSDGDRYGDAYEAALLGLAAANNPSVKPRLGDLNKDGFVSNVDALITQSLFIGNINHTSGVFGGDGFIWSDANRDGFYSNVDALIFQSWFLGNAPLLPVGL